MLTNFIKRTFRKKHQTGVSHAGVFSICLSSTKTNIPPSWLALAALALHSRPLFVVYRLLAHQRLDHTLGSLFAALAHTSLLGGVLLTPGPDLLSAGVELRTLVRSLLKDLHTPVQSVCWLLTNPGPRNRDFIPRGSFRKLRALGPKTNFSKQCGNGKASFCLTKQKPLEPLNLPG